MNKEHKHTNELIHETSPYLLQHAHNPVNWRAWNDETLALAKKSNKPLLISIGYSACHWCHVMEHESFEDEEVAQIMNEHFICIKVDREERPDVDQVYMSAVQLITGSGGWPLNCFALPDGRPFHGGTYFQKNQWMSVLKAVNKEFTTNPEKLEAFAARLTKGIVQGNIVPKNQGDSINYAGLLEEMTDKWKSSLDNEWGGPDREPKFPLPNNYQYLMQNALLYEDEALDAHVKRTLDRMAQGGIYDQIGGGFARYSTDKFWKVPHFEKMLYDNAQLLSLYADGYRKYRDPMYIELIKQTVDFIERELKDESHAFYSALDADSEGEEGKFYIWSEKELLELFGDDFNLLQDMYHLNRFGEWEGHYILMQNKSAEEIMNKHKLSEKQWNLKKLKVQERLLKVRAKRIRPGLDDKSLTSWNAMTISGLIDAYEATGYEKALKLAKNNASFIRKNQITRDQIWHSYKAGKSSIKGFIEDYAFVIQAWIDLYRITLEETYLKEATELTERALEHFFDEEQHMFRFNAKTDQQLIVNSIEYQDNVIPSANSVMARNFQSLFLLTGKTRYRDYSDQMLASIAPLTVRYGSAFSNWSMLMLGKEKPHFEIVLVGKDAEEAKEKLMQYYLPHCLVIGSNKDLDHHLLEGRYVKGKTLAYVCQNNSCLLPVDASETSKILQMVGVKAK